MPLPPRINVVRFASLSGVPLEEHGVTDSYLGVLREMFEDVRLVSTDDCTCDYCTEERARYQREETA